MTPGALQAGDAGAAQRHEGGVVHIDGGDGAGALFGRRSAPEWRRRTARSSDRRRAPAARDRRRRARRRAARNKSADVEVGGAPRPPGASSSARPRSIDDGGDKRRADGRRQQHDACRCSRKAARPEPTAMAMAKMARCKVTTLSAPCSVCVTSGGISDMAMEPKSQKRLVTMARRHQRPARRANAAAAEGRDARYWRSILQIGAARRVDGMNQAAP